MEVFLNEKTNEELLMGNLDLNAEAHVVIERRAKKREDSRETE